MSRRRRRPVEPWRQRALAQREAARAAGATAGAAADAESAHAGGGETERGDASDAASARPPGPPPPPPPLYSPRRGFPDREPFAMESLSPEVTAPPRHERRRGPRFNLVTGTLLLSSMALIGGFLIVNTVLMPSFTRQGTEVRVPEVIGLSEREAERSLAGLDLRLSKISEQWSADVPRGFITMQEPPPGGLVKRGRRISVVVSLGAQGTSVPVLDGSTERQAGILLESAGLRRGKIARLYTDEVSRDLVIATDPPGETVVEQETVVDLLVSLGPPPRGYVLPDLTGRNLNGVARGLRDEGFFVTAREGGPRQKSDAVAAQEPPAGHRVEPRDSIVLYYHP